MKPYNILARTTNIDYDEWLRYRPLGIGGSEAAAVLGLNPYSSAVDVYADKLGLAPEKEETEAMRIGTALEPYVAERFTAVTGKKVRRLNAVLQSREHPYMLANVDRLIVGEHAGLECKTTSPWTKCDWGGGLVPEQYYVQCMHYMAVMDMPTWYLAVLVLGNGFYWYRVDRNEDDIAALIQAEEEFWHKVETKTPPDPDGSDAAGAIIKSMYNGADDGEEIVLTGLTDDLARYTEIETLKKALETEENMIKQRIQLQMGGAQRAYAPGYRVHWTTSSRSTVDSKRLRAEMPEIAEQYTKTSTSRRFTIRAEKAEA